MKKALSALFIGLISASAFADLPPFPGDNDRDRHDGYVCVARSNGWRGDRNFLGLGATAREAARNALANCERARIDRTCHVVSCRQER